jgi:hypothetical protein
LQNERLIFAKHVACGNTKKKAVANLACSAGDCNANGGLHFFSSNKGG